tara:strand:- start:1278 stop:1934 length:657 start_codon:yes stop_codon:yes gene_type:complete
VLDINIKMRGAADEYFEQLGVSQRVRALSHGYYTWLCACKGIRARWRRRRCVYSFRYCRHPKVRAPPLRVPMANFTPATIVRAFGGCARHRALAFRSLFAALDAKPRDYPAPGMGWLNRRAMVALLRPAPPLAAVVSRLERCLTSGCDGNAPADADADAGAGTDSAPAGTRAPAPAPARRLACVHLRRGDFEEECAKYDAEIGSSSPRPWVCSHAAPG